MFMWSNERDCDRSAHDVLLGQFASVSAMETLLAALFPPLPGLSAWIPVISAQLPILDPRGMIVGFEDLGVDAFRQPLDDAAPAAADGEHRVQLALYIRPTVSSVTWLLREVNTYRTYQSVYRDAPAREVLVVGTSCPE